MSSVFKPHKTVRTFLKLGPEISFAKLLEFSANMAVIGKIFDRSFKLNKREKRIFRVGRHPANKSNYISTTEN